MSLPPWLGCSEPEGHSEGWCCFLGSTVASCRAVRRHLHHRHGHQVSARGALTSPSVSRHRRFPADSITGMMDRCLAGAPCSPRWCCLSQCSSGDTRMPPLSPATPSGVCLGATTWGSPVGMALGLKALCTVVNSCTWVPAPWDVPGQALKLGEMSHSPTGCPPDTSHWGMGGNTWGDICWREHSTRWREGPQHRGLLLMG